MTDDVSDVSKRAYRIAYDGQDYHGFQRQPDVATVSDAILDALRALDVLDADVGADNNGDADADAHTDVPPGYAAAGRTDAGVSAVAQTVAFDAPDWLTPAAMNAELPADVRAWASADVPADFHATHDATERVYTYYLHAPDASLALAAEAMDRLAGQHDLHNLTPDDQGTVRDLSTSVERDGPILVLSVRAGGFPRQLVRRLVTVVEGIATGTMATDFLDRILSEAVLSGPDGVGPAPPAPLVLRAVEYPGVEFVVDDEAAASAGTVFGERAAALAARTRVCETLSTLQE